VLRKWHMGEPWPMGLAIRRRVTARADLGCCSGTGLAGPNDRSATLKNMKTVGVRALKQNASAVVAEAVAGEIVTITDRGRPVAQLIPLPASRVDALVAAGRARPPKRSLADLGAAPKRRRGQPSLTSLLDEMRDDERY